MKSVENLEHQGIGGDTLGHEVVGIHGLFPAHTAAGGDEDKRLNGDADCLWIVCAFISPDVFPVLSDYQVSDLELTPGSGVRPAEGIALLRRLDLDGLELGGRCLDLRGEHGKPEIRP